MGRTARGVRGINLRQGDYVIGVVKVEDEKKLLTITENGYGKRTEFDDFRLMKHRGGLGVTAHNITDKTGNLAGILSVDDNSDVMMITDAGIIIRTPAKDISTYSRSASGVIVMRLEEGQTIANITKVAREEDGDGDFDGENQVEEADTEITDAADTADTEESTEE